VRFRQRLTSSDIFWQLPKGQSPATALRLD
jgi:hypothetical protein